MTRIEEAARRLEAAVGRLEAALARHAGRLAAADGEARRLAAALTAAEADYVALEETAATVADRLDATIGRLAEALEA